LKDISKKVPERDYARSSYIADVEKIHNSIVLHNLDATTEEESKNKQIFFIKDDDIYHYKNGTVSLP